MLLSQVPSYFKARRDSLIKANPGSVFVFPSNPEVFRNPDVAYPFRQESNFFYLSGFEEPESMLVLAPSVKPGSGHRMILFVKRRDREREMWEGERYGIEGAMKVFGADEAYLTEDFGSRIPEYLAGCERIFYRIGQDEAFDRKMVQALEKSRASQGRSGKALMPVMDPNEVLGEMRLFKSPQEVSILRKACQITAQAHKTAMREVKPGMNEFEVEALMDYSFRRSGCQRVGYGSIVAGGVNATCLHYRLNNQPLRERDLLLIDAGGELDYYTADITRTFPIGKGFSKAQAQVYSLVLRAQKEGINLARPGAKLPEIHKRVCEILTDGMLELSLLKGTQEEIMKSQAYRRFYPHNTSHWLGIDVHDVGLYTKNGEPRALEPGMVFTVEPGFYVQPNDAEALADFRDIGIRIEDDVLVTSGGCEVLTRDVPKEIAEIEALRN